MAYAPAPPGVFSVVVPKPKPKPPAVAPSPEPVSPQVVSFASQTPAEQAQSSDDPFAGTPYAGMGAYEIAQKIIEQEKADSLAQINQARDWQAANNSRDLQTLLGFSQALGNQQDYLAGYQNSAQNFQAGYNDTMKQLQGQGNPSTAFNWGMFGTQEGAALEAKNSQDLAQAYASQIADLNSSKAGDVFSLYQNIQGTFDSAAAAKSKVAADAYDAQTAAQAAQDKIDAKAAADKITAAKYAQSESWKSYNAADQEAHWLSNYTHVMWKAVQDPKTGGWKPVQAHDSKTHKLIPQSGYTVQGNKIPKPTTKKISPYLSGVNHYLTYTDGSKYINPQTKSIVRIPPKTSTSVKPTPLTGPAQAASGLPYLAGLYPDGHVGPLLDKKGNPIPYNPPKKTTKAASSPGKSTAANHPGTGGFRAKAEDQLREMPHTISNDAKQYIQAGVQDPKTGKITPVYSNHWIWNKMYSLWAPKLFLLLRRARPGLGKGGYQPLVEHYITTALGFDVNGNNIQ